MPLDLLVMAVLARWRRVVLLALALAAGGAATILLWPRSFLATAVVAPAETSGLAASAMLAPAAPVQAALLEPRPGGNFAVFLAALRTREAAAMLAGETPLLAHLTERRNALPLGPIRRLLGLRLQADLDDATSWLQRRLAATQAIGSVTWTITLSHPEAAQAELLLAQLLGFAEAKVHADLAGTAARRIAAISQQLRHETDSFLRAALYDQLGQQQRAALVVQADAALAARTVAPPMVELRPSEPNRPLLLLLLALLAPMLALLLTACGVLLRGAAAPALQPARRERAEA